MMFTLTKEQMKEHEKELIKFCEKNHCLMWNHMILIQQIRNERKFSNVGNSVVGGQE